MNLTPVLIISLILLIITILLAIADKLLVYYGECKITVRQDEETKEFVVQGGSSLLTDLTENKINITSSCAGKATCGYCKVKLLDGGGPILPTEEIFMSREEKHSGMRLACQVKVKEDMEIYIPDFLTTVKDIVKNKTYDTKLRWQVMMDGRGEGAEAKAVTKFSHKDRHKVHEIIQGYKDVPGATVPILQRIGDTFNYLPEPVLRYAAKALDKPISDVYRIATFYNAFSLKPRGKNIITVCLGTACHVKGAGNITEALEKELGIKLGETTEDMLFSLEAVRCIGCCGLAPVLKINDDVHGLVTRKMVPGLIASYKGAQQNA
jgi:NADH:ubiquinone oxidoreductase subunit E/ferredoxin